MEAQHKEGEGESPATVRFPGPAQPEPVETRVEQLGFPGGYVACAVSRVWEHGATRKCRLCVSCRANHERAVCTVLVDQAVDADSARLFSTRALTLVASGHGDREPSADRFG